MWPASLDPSSGAQLSFRPSQNKFPSAHCDLEVVNWARFMPAHLNRQIIILLTALGVGSPIFYTLQVGHWGGMHLYFLGGDGGLTSLVLCQVCQVLWARSYVGRDVWTGK